MSQAGLARITQGVLPPSVATSYVTNSGTAIPVANVLNVLGQSIASGSTPVHTTGAGNTVTVDVQTSQAIAATDATKIGLAAFNNTEFTVDANGFVSLVGGGSSIQKINVQIGTSPVVPLAGAITFNGTVVSAGTNPVRTDGTGANTMALEVQLSQALAASDATKVGLANFNSLQFSVDANGFVSALGAGNFIWQDVSGAFISKRNNGYFITATASSTLPAGASEGDTILYALDTTQILTLTANAGQTIRIGNNVSSSGGTAVSTLRGDSLSLVFRSVSQSWIAVPAPVGTWTLA